MNKNLRIRLHLLWLVLLFLPGISVQAQRKMEKLGRSMVAVRTGSSQVYVGWRLLGTDPDGIGFNVYRGSAKLNSTPVTATTNYVDNTTTNESYTVRPVINGVEGPASAPATVWAQQFLKIPLQQPAGGTSPDGVDFTYTPNDASVADLDGDGEYDIVLKWDPTNSKDNSQSGYTGNVYLDGYKMNGTRLWRIDLGKNIRAGAHYTQFLVYDFDSDGKAEVVCKTADGTKDGKGVVIGNASADYRNSSGYILSGPEFLTIFNGTTGAAISTVNYLPARGTVSSWGDSYGNRVDRFIACVSYLDGVNPSIIMGRGYYTRLVRVAWDFVNNQLVHRWTFDSNTSGNGGYAGMGNHQLITGDLDGDGKDEMVNGSSAVNDNGTGLYTNGLGHGDAIHMSDMDPDRPGQEIWMCLEEQSKYGTKGLVLNDAKTGQTIWGVPTSGDVGRATAADLDPRYKGYECWGIVGGLFTCKGQQITTSRPSVNHLVWWDADLQRELLDGTKLDKWNYTTNSSNRLYTLYLPENGTAAENNSTKANPCVTADILGDWREEIVMRSADNQNLLVYTTTIPAINRIYTLMHDPQYRLAVAWQNTEYNQPPHPGYYLGEGMAAPPKPNITLVGNLPPVASAGTDQTLQLPINTATLDGSGSSDPDGSITTYSWTKISGPAAFSITNAAAASTVVNILTEGVYQFRLGVTDNTGATAADTVTITVQSVQPDSFSVLPNPTATGYGFTILQTGTFRYRLFDMLGRLLLEGQSVNKLIFGRYLKSGTYILEVKTGSETFVKKIVKQ